MILKLYIFFYDCFIKTYGLLAWFLSFYNTKAAQFINGRRDFFIHNKPQLSNTNNLKTIWIHCASLGEFEQAKPIIEALFAKNKYFLVLSFFSPSGYNASKSYPFVHAILYLPLDTKTNAQQWLSIINPQLIIFVKYEFWYHYLTQSKKQNIPIILASAIFRENQPFFKWYNVLHLTMLQCFSKILVQNNHSLELLQQLPCGPVVCTGDTRFDRVVHIANEAYSNAIIEQFIHNKPCLIAGSTWPEDLAALQYFITNNKEVAIIIAPHEIDNDSLAVYKKALPTANFYTTLKSKEAAINSNILIVDTIGILSKIYRYATICYVGGGFGKDGVHNVLEASVYGKPVLFGPVYNKFIEAVELIKAEGAISLGTGIEISTKLNSLFYDNTKENEMSKKSYNFTKHHAGATNKTLDILELFL